MNFKEKATELIERAEAKAEADFQKWKNGYLVEKLKHRKADEVKAILEERYKLISDSLLKHEKPYYDGEREDLIGWYTAFFRDLADGLQPLPGTTPLHWENVLADRMEARKCLAYIDALLSEPISKNRERWDIFFPIAESLAAEFEITSWIARPMYVGENTKEAWKAYLAMNEEDKKKYQNLDEKRIQTYAFERAFENCLKWHIYFEKMQKDPKGQKKEVEEKVMELRKRVENIRKQYRKAFLKPDNDYPNVSTDNEGGEWQEVKIIDDEGSEREDRRKLENPYTNQLRSVFSDAVLAAYLEKVFELIKPNVEKDEFEPSENSVSVDMAGFSELLLTN